MISQGSITIDSARGAVVALATGKAASAAGVGSFPWSSTGFSPPVSCRPVWGDSACNRGSAPRHNKERK